MKILDKSLELDEKDTLSHLRYFFTLDSNYNDMIIKLRYSPRVVPLELEEGKIEKCINKYIPPNYIDGIKKFVDNFKIENLITTSLKYDGNLIGGWHNKSNDQVIKISEKFSSHGYRKFKIQQGKYELVISLHSVNCPVKIEFSLEVV